MLQFCLLTIAYSLLATTVKQTNAFCSPEKQSGGESRLVCDLRYLDKYNNELKADVPQGKRYGGRAVVENGKIVEISGLLSNDNNFPRCKSAFLSSFALHVVVVRHAVMTHLSICQRLLVKLTTGRNASYREAFQKNLGPSLLLRALTYRTNMVSINEQLLIGPGNSLVGRACSLTNEGLTELGLDTYKKYSDMSPDDLVAEVGMNGIYSWNKACRFAWEGAQEVVERICNINDMGDVVKKEDLLDLSLILWVSTFYHGFIGDFQLDNLCKGNLLLTLAETNGKNDLGYITLATTIGVTTMTRTMNLCTLGSYLPKEEERDAWNKYIKLLQSIDVPVAGYSLAAAVYTGVNF
jgi:hypothetical protein